MTPQPQSHFYYSARLRLHYSHWPNPGKPTLLLIHGGEDHNRNWDRVVARLHPDFDIIAPDLRGHGESEWVNSGTYTITAFVLDIANLIEHLGWQRTRILAHSLGGAIALKYTGAFPDKVSHLVAIEGVGPSPEQEAERNARDTAEIFREWIAKTQTSARRQPVQYPSLEDATARMKKKNDHLDAALAEHLTRHSSRRLEDGSYAWKHDPMLRPHPAFDMTPEESRNLWREITCPVLLVRGEDSWAADPGKDGRSECFRDATTINIPDAGHWVHHDQLDAFMDITLPFLEEETPSAT